MRRRARSTAPARRTGPIRRSGRARRARNDYDFDYAGTTGELDQNEYGGDLYGGGRYGRGPFEQSQRYGARGFGSGTGAYGSLQKQFENRYTSGGYSGLKTSGRALGGPPGAGSTPSNRNRLPRTGPGSQVVPARNAAGSRRKPAEPKHRRSKRAAAPTRSRSAAPTRRRTAAATRARSTAAPARASSASRRSAPSGRAASSGRRPAAKRSASSRRAAAPRRSSNSFGRASTSGRASGTFDRNDARIGQEICERLARPGADLDLAGIADERLDVSDVRVSVAGGRVTLEGTVPERRMKPYIEALVDACPGVQDIDNRLRVQR